MTRARRRGKRQEERERKMVDSGSIACARDAAGLDRRPLGHCRSFWLRGRRRRRDAAIPTPPLTFASFAVKRWSPGIRNRRGREEKKAGRGRGRGRGRGQARQQGRGRGGARMPREGRGRGVSAIVDTAAGALGSWGSAWDRAPCRLPGLELSMVPAWDVDQTMVGSVGDPDHGSSP